MMNAVAPGMKRAFAMSAALTAALLGAGAGLADTVDPIDAEAPLEEVLFGAGDPGKDDIWVEEEEFGEVAWDEEYVQDWEDWIAWSGVPLEDDGIFYAFGGPGEDWVKRGDGVAPVPLPGAGLLLVGGLIGLGLLRRRG